MAGPLGIRRASTFDYEAAKNVCQQAALKTVLFGIGAAVAHFLAPLARCVGLC